MPCHILSCQVQAGSSHCLAASKGGDLYVWGRGDSGQLGLGDRDSKQIPTLNAAFPEGTEISQASELIACTDEEQRRLVFCPRVINPS